MPQLLNTLTHLPWLSIVGLVYGVSTAVHTFALAVGWKRTAEISGVIGADLQQVFQWLGGAPVVKP